MSSEPPIFISFGRWGCYFGRLRPFRCNKCRPGECKHDLKITYRLTKTPLPDQPLFSMDTETNFLDYGPACPGGGRFDFFSSCPVDNENPGEQEEVFKTCLCVGLARSYGVWTSSTVVTCRAGFLSSELPPPASYTASISVTYKGETRSKAIAPGWPSECPLAQVATVTIFDNGSWILA